MVMRRKFSSPDRIDDWAQKEMAKSYTLENTRSQTVKRLKLDPESSDYIVKTKKFTNVATQTPPSSNSHDLDQRFSAHDPSEPKKQQAQTWMMQGAGSAWHIAVLFLTEVLLICSVVGLALLTVGSLMFGGAVIIMTTGVPFLAFTALLLSPLLLSLSPVLIVLGSGLFLAGSGLLTAAGFGSYYYSLICWLYDYMVAYSPPGSKEFAALNKRLRHAPVKLLLRFSVFTSSVATYLRFFRETAIHGSRLVKVLLMERKRKSLKPVEMHDYLDIHGYIYHARKFTSALAVLSVFSVAAVKKLLNGWPEARA